MPDRGKAKAKGPSGPACLVPGCAEPARAMELCQRCYQSWYMYRRYHGEGADIKAWLKVRRTEQICVHCHKPTRGSAYRGVCNPCADKLRNDFDVPNIKGGFSKWPKDLI